MKASRWIVAGAILFFLVVSITVLFFSWKKPRFNRFLNWGQPVYTEEQIKDRRAKDLETKVKVEKMMRDAIEKRDGTIRKRKEAR